MFYIPIEIWSYHNEMNHYNGECIVDYFVFIFFGIANEAEILCVLLGYHNLHGLYTTICHKCHGKCVEYATNMTKTTANKGH